MPLHKTKTTYYLTPNDEVNKMNKEEILKKELKQIELQFRKYPNRIDLKLAMLKINTELTNLKRNKTT